MNRQNKHISGKELNYKHKINNICNCFVGMAPFGNMLTKIFLPKFQLQKNKQCNQIHKAKLTPNIRKKERGRGGR